MEDASWLRQDPLAALLALLGRDDDEVRVVGGAVRDALLGLRVGEVDLATTATPDKVIARVERAGFKAVPTGRDHGTITVVAGGRPFEVTTLREDVETDGRHARVRFGRDWQADAKRRDFTVNALSLAPDGTVFDMVGGLADLAARSIRFVGDPAARIREDYLRILRFFRFHAQIGRGDPDPEAMRAIIGLQSGLDALSRERVRAELMKLLLAPAAAEALALMSDVGVLSRLLAGVPDLASFGRLVTLEEMSGSGPDPIRRLAVLAAWTSNDVPRLRERLRLSNAESERLAAMMESVGELRSDLDEHAARALLYRLRPSRFTDRVLVAASRSRTQQDLADWRGLLDLPRRWSAPAFPLKASDLIATGVAPGPQLGAALRAAEQAWITAAFPLDRASLDTIVAAAAHAIGTNNGIERL